MFNTTYHIYLYFYEDGDFRYSAVRPTVYSRKANAERVAKSLERCFESTDGKYIEIVAHVQPDKVNIEALKTPDAVIDKIYEVWDTIDTLYDDGLIEEADSLEHICLELEMKFYELTGKTLAEVI